jgi:hypothetical protein
MCGKEAEEEKTVRSTTLDFIRLRCRPSAQAVEYPTGRLACSMIAS